jgi:hypothetical protein
MDGIATGGASVFGGYAFSGHWQLSRKKCHRMWICAWFLLAWE